MIEVKKSSSKSGKSGVVVFKSRKVGSRSGIKKRVKAPKNRDKMLSCRYELKYRIPEGKARAIAEYVQAFLAIDRYSQDKPGHEYPISSLYFDSEKLNLCKETINKKTNRFKLRVRCYDDDPMTPCFFEIKRRLNNVILKDRARISKDAVAAAVLNNHVPDSLFSDHKKILRQFQFYVAALRARPMVLVRYLRQAYEGDSMNRVRITFDRKLSYNIVDKPQVRVGGAGWQLVPMDFVILEIKFTERYPAWLSDMVKIFDLKQSAMSKYVSTIRQSSELGFCAPIYKVGI